MLVPAISRKEELIKRFSEVIYDYKYFYYAGYSPCHEIPNFKLMDNKFEWAIVDEHDKVVGFLSYTIFFESDSVSNFGLYGFEPSIIIGKDAYCKIRDMIHSYRRIEWRCIASNPIAPLYEKVCKKYNGRILTLKESAKDPNGIYQDEYIYEILNPNPKYNLSNILK